LDQFFTITILNEKQSREKSSLDEILDYRFHKARTEHAFGGRTQNENSELKSEKLFAYV
jgi:hypothetical protein